jgi:hypothetical protein
MEGLELSISWLDHVARQTHKEPQSDPRSDRMLQERIVHSFVDDGLMQRYGR